MPPKKNRSALRLMNVEEALEVFNDYDSHDDFDEIESSDIEDEVHEPIMSMEIDATDNEGKLTLVIHVTRKR